MTLRSLTSALVTLALLAPLAPAQTLLGSDNINLLAWEFSPSQANPCPQPNPFLAQCPYAVGVCGNPPPGFAQPGQLWGDIADDPLTDTFYLTGGRIIEQYSLDTPCVGPMTCGPINSFFGPTSMTEITGMGFDNTGGVVAPLGTPLLWITDGLRIAAVTPLPCSMAVVYGPCTVTGLAAGEFMTDITWDPSSGSAWVCTSTGNVHQIDVTGCNIVSSFTPVFCNGVSGAPLTGIAFDAGTPALAPLPVSQPTLYVTEGSLVERLTTTGGAPLPTFGSPNPCTPTPSFISGLALTQHGGTYGFPRLNARLESYGQTSSPGPTFGLEVWNPPAGANAWMILNFSFPGPGYFCPPVPGAGTLLWVDPAPPAFVNNLGPLGPGCTPIPLPVPPAVPAGLEMFAQFVFLPTSGPPAVDATNGVYSTVMVP